METSEGRIIEKMDTEKAEATNSLGETCFEKVFIKQEIITPDDHEKMESEKPLICNITSFPDVIIKEEITLPDSRKNDDHIPKMLITFPNEAENAFKDSNEIMNTELKHSCHTCGKTFSKHKSFMKHLSSHTVQGKKKECPLCLKKFKRDEDLKNHQTDVHVKPFSCKHCPERFSNQKAMNEHLALVGHVHVASKNKVCGMCQKVFADRNALRSHAYSHTSENIFKCEFCKKAYTDAYSFKSHLRSHKGKKIREVLKNYSEIHPVENFFKSEEWNNMISSYVPKLLLKQCERKTFQCGECSEIFKVDIDFNLHLLKHIEETEMIQQESPELLIVVSLKK